MVRYFAGYCRGACGRQRRWGDDKSTRARREVWQRGRHRVIDVDVRDRLAASKPMDAIVVNEAT